MPLVFLIALLVSNECGAMPLVSVTYNPDCADEQMGEVIECVYREFIEDDLRRGPACYFLACAGGTTGVFSDPSQEFLERLIDAGAPVAPYSSWSAASLDQRGDAASNEVTQPRLVNCGVVGINWYVGDEGLAVLEVHGAVPDTTVFLVGLARNQMGEWVAGVF
jgi:hypothetical protein